MPQFPHVQNEHDDEDGNEFQTELTDTALASVCIFVNKTNAGNAAPARPAGTKQREPHSEGTAACNLPPRAPFV